MTAPLSTFFGINETPNSGGEQGRGVEGLRLAFHDGVLSYWDWSDAFARMKQFNFLKVPALAMALCGSGFVPGPILAATNEPSPVAGLVIRKWSTDNGLPQNTVNTIKQTRDGYLWLGTQEGLARFDGVRFKVFGLQDGLPSVEVRAICEDPDGALWIGTSGGLSRMVEGTIQTVPLAQRRVSEAGVTALTEDYDGRLWVGTRNGVELYQQGRFVEEPALATLEQVAIQDLTPSGDGMWIAGGVHGLFEFHDHHLTEYPGPAGTSRIYAHCLLLDQSSNLWVSIGNGSVLRRRNGEWIAYTESDGLPFAYITCMAQEANGAIWAGSLDYGLYRFDAGHFTAIREENGLSADDIRSLCPDGEGNLWVGTRIGGVDRLSRSKLIAYGAAQGLTNDFTRSVAEGKDGALWVGTIGGGIYHGKSGMFYRTPDEADGFRFAFVDSVLATTDGSIWYGAYRGLMRIKNGELTECHTNESWVRSTSVTALCEDGQGGLWAGTADSKLLHYQNGSFVEFPHRVARGMITALAVEANGALWVGSEAGGLKRLKSGNDLVLSVTNGLLSQSIRTLHLAAEGSLWIGTLGGGLSEYYDGRISTFTTRQGLWADTISQIVEDDNGNFWFGCNHGIFRVSKKELNDLAEGKTRFVHPRVFGLSDGMPAEECSSGFCPAGLRTRDGLLCFSTVKGLVLVDPNAHVKALPHEALLEEILVNGEVIPVGTNLSHTADNGKLSSRITIPHGAWEVEFHYTAISLSSPELVRFRYRLESLDKDWVEAAGRRTAYYHRIPPGNYTFQVTACNADGIWGAQRASLAIAVQPYFWETWWFEAAAVVSILGLVAAVMRLMERRRYRQLQMQNAIAKERLRISQDIHDDIGSILTQISQISDLGLDEPKTRTTAKEQFERIGNQSRAAVQALDEIVWATNPKNDNLSRFADYVCRFADEYFENSTVRCWQEVPANLPAVLLRSNVRHNVFLAIKEALTNILKHAGATEVWLRVALADFQVSVEIEDNGRGLVPAELRPGGNGLANMRTRLEECDGSAEITSGPKGGTKIRFTFPLTKVD
jgi:ligand-binding sensor domain-containing protein/signal transduction histidine kinase